jgi:hypothetical protein
VSVGIAGIFERERRVGPEHLTRRCRARAGCPNGLAIRERSATSWVDRLGTEKAVGLEDILIIAPYNARVFDSKDRIPGAKIGTVDKRQGQESHRDLFHDHLEHADAPRGMTFLYSLNRLNVATSRA